eukprot:jgi/Mesen1/2348/ME000156S01495
MSWHLLTSRSLLACCCPLLPQHPHEARQRLATVPLLARCLATCHVIRGRRFFRGSSPLLDELLGADSAPRAPPVAPGGSDPGKASSFAPSGSDPPEVSLPTTPGGSQDPDSGSVALPTCHVDGTMGACSGSPQGKASREGKVDREGEGDREGDEAVVLVVMDGTWQYAREMLQASLPFLREHTQLVCLPYDPAREGSCLREGGLLVRKEPKEGFVSTMEAVARALGVLEENGAHVEHALLLALGKMAS